MQTLKEDQSVTLNYELRITDMPNDILLTSTLPEEIKVNYSGHGWSVLQQLISNEQRFIEINFNEINQRSGKLNIDANVLSRAVIKKMPKELRYISASPNKIEAYYSNGQHKRVPIRFNGKITTGVSRYECGIFFSPDSVDIYAPQDVFDSIKVIFTKALTFSELEDTLVTKIALDTPTGVKVVPDSVKTTICVDLFTDNTITVPIFSENTPKNEVIKTFPSQAQVTFQVSSSLYRSISADDFMLVVDYNELKANMSKCKVHIRQKPTMIRQVRLSPEYVEFVIEHQEE